MWRGLLRQGKQDLAGCNLNDPEIPSRAWKIFDVINAIFCCRPSPLLRAPSS
jgi:hypothetical protein